MAPLEKYWGPEPPNPRIDAPDCFLQTWQSVRLIPRSSTAVQTSRQSVAWWSVPRYARTAPLPWQPIRHCTQLTPTCSIWRRQRVPSAPSLAKSTPSKYKHYSQPTRLLSRLLLSSYHVYRYVCLHLLHYACSSYVVFLSHVRIRSYASVNLSDVRHTSILRQKG